MSYLKQLRDLLQRREDAWAKCDALNVEIDAVGRKRLTQDERDEMLNGLEKRERQASKEWDDASHAVDDCVDVNTGPEVLAELKALTL